MTESEYRLSNDSAEAERLSAALRDSAGWPRPPDGFAVRCLAAIRIARSVGRVTGHSPVQSGWYSRRWVKVAASVAAMVGFAGLAAVVGRVVLNAPEEPGGRSTMSATGGAEATPTNPEKDIFDVNQGEDNMIMIRKVASLVGASLLSVAAPGTEITSEPTFVFLRPETSSFWNTATNSTMTLPIDYPAGATKATLTVSGVGYDTKTYPNLTDSSFELELPVPNSPQAENVYDLTLTFDEGTVRTAKLGLIQGLAPDAEGSTRCLAPAEGKVWNTIKKRAVMPIPYGTTSFTVSVNGRQTVNGTGLDGAQGWYALKPAGGDNVSLSLVVDGINYVATLIGQGDGFLVNFK